MEDYEYNHSGAEEKIEHALQESIVCPYCGYDYGYKRSPTMIGNTTNAWKFDIECNACEKRFSVSWDFYETEDKEKEDEELEFSTYHEKQEDFVRL